MEMAVSRLRFYGLLANLWTVGLAVAKGWDFLLFGGVALYCLMGLTQLWLCREQPREDK